MGAIAIVLYVGLALTPLAALGVFVRPARLVAARWRWRVSAFVAATVAVVMLHKVLPVTGNILNTTGLGAQTIGGGGDQPALPMAVRFVLTLAAVGTALWAGRHAWGTAHTIARRSAQPVAVSDAIRATALAAAALYAAAIAPVWVYDRYVLPLIAMTMIVAAPEIAPRRTGAWLAGALCALQLAVSVAGTHDYLSWNRARWDAVAALRARGYAPGDIDGGLEVNGWLSNDGSARPQAVFDLRLSEPGLEGMERYPYRTWLPPGTRDIVVVRR
jgi:hypothetical protein